MVHGFIMTHRIQDVISNNVHACAVIHTNQNGCISAVLLQGSRKPNNINYYDLMMYPYLDFSIGG